MSTLKSRLERLERDLGEQGNSCPDCSQVYIADDGWYGEEPAEPVIPPCPTCGRERTNVIRVIQDKNWYGNNAHEMERARAEREQADG